MKKLKHKFKVLKEILRDDIALSTHFGIYFGLLHFVMKVLCRSSKTKLGRLLYRYIYNLIEDKCSQEYKELIDEYKLIELDFDDISVTNDSNIWVFWWQGLEQAPKIVKNCIDSIKKHAGQHTVVVITKDNFFQYADIPEYILKKVGRGISLTHFSDILRLELLYRHGGIWMDATLLMTGTIPETVYRLPLFTIKHMKYSNFHVCRGLWSGFFLCATKDNKFIRFSRDFLFEYWKRNNYLICYLLIDVAFCLAYDNFSWAKKMIDDVPVNCIDVFSLQENMNKAYDRNTMQRWCENTFVHKMSYKIPFEEYVDGKPTFWNCLKSQVEDV